MTQPNSLAPFIYFPLFIEIILRKISNETLLRKKKCGLDFVSVSHVSELTLWSLLPGNAGIVWQYVYIYIYIIFGILRLFKKQNCYIKITFS